VTYAARVPTNGNLLRDIGELLTPPVGRRVRLRSNSVQNTPVEDGPEYNF
jgi:hypothetical protein